MLCVNKRLAVCFMIGENIEKKPKTGGIFFK